MAWFVGLDLAWSPHRETGLCVFEGDASSLRLVTRGAMVVEPGALARTLEELGEDVVAAIDAPLRLADGRCSERHLARAFGRYHAAPYTASETFLRRSGFAGPLLATALAARGFSLDPASIGSGARGRHAFEVYPHAAHVALFELRRILPYKKGRVAARVVALGRYQELLGTALASLPGDLTRALGDLLAPEALEVRGSARKRLEDQLDAVTCAIVAYRAWLLGSDGLALFGCAEHGHIVTPGLPAGAEMPLSPCVERRLPIADRRGPTSARGRSCP